MALSQQPSHKPPPSLVLWSSHYNEKVSGGRNKYLSHHKEPHSPREPVPVGRAHTKPTWYRRDLMLQDHWGKMMGKFTVWLAWQLDSSAYLCNFQFTTAILFLFTTWKQAVWGREENISTFIQYYFHFRSLSSKNIALRGGRVLVVNPSSLRNKLLAY